MPAATSIALARIPPRWNRAKRADGRGDDRAGAVPSGWKSLENGDRPKPSQVADRLDADGIGIGGLSVPQSATPPTPLLNLCRSAASGARKSTAGAVEREAFATQESEERHRRATLHHGAVERLIWTMAARVSEANPCDSAGPMPKAPLSGEPLSTSVSDESASL